MRRIQFFVATLVTLLTAAGGAQAVSVTDYTVGYTISYSSIAGNSPTGVSGGNSVQVPIANEIIAPTQFMTIVPAGCYSNSPGKCDAGTASGIVTISFTVSNGSQTLTQSVNGLYQAKYNGKLGCSMSGGTETDCIDWGINSLSKAPTSPVNTPFDVAFYFSNGESLAVVLDDFSDWDLKPKMGFDDPVPTPLPAALPLFAAGIGLFGLAGSWRKRRQQKRSLSV